MTAAALAGHAQTTPVPEKHPVDVPNGQCSQCHVDKYKGQEHTADWFETHRFQGAQSSNLCTMCHTQSYCADCHTDKDELKPNEKYRESPARKMPHRGDYLSRHKIDARIDPAPCFRCHGRGNNGKCRICHK